jgi:iron complex transport system substrate-binding protein
VTGSGPGSAKDVTTVYTDPTFRQLKAAKRERVDVAPVGAHTWAHRTAERPLTVLWTTKTLSPELFAELDLVAEVKAFYRDFFGHELTDAQVAEILSGTL